MTSSHEDLIALWEEAANTPTGPGANQLWAQLATQAEEAGDEHIALRANLSLCNAYLETEEFAKLLVPFVWCTNKYREKPELFDDHSLYLYGWSFKYVLIALRQLPQVARQQCLDILEEMRLFYLQMGESLRPYYSQANSLYENFGEMETAVSFYEQWKDAPVTRLADCTACDPEDEVYHEIDRGDWEAAARVGDAALAAEGRRCSNQPNSMLSMLLEPWFRTGRDAEAWAAHLRVYRDYQTRVEKTGSLYQHLDYLYLSGRPERLERARRILIRHLPSWPQVGRRISLLRLACSAANVVSALPGDHEREVLPVTLPGDKLAAAPRQTLTNPTLRQAEDWFASLARDIAGQLDRRPGVTRTAWQDSVERYLARRPLAHGEVQIPDASGLLGDDATDYHLSASEESPGDAVGAPAGDAARSGDAARAVSDGPGDVTNGETEQQAPPAGTVLRPVVSVEVRGPWRDMDYAQLLTHARKVGEIRRSVYAVELMERLAYGRENRLPDGELGVRLRRWLASALGEDNPIVAGFEAAVSTAPTPRGGDVVEGDATEGEAAEDDAAEDDAAWAAIDQAWRLSDQGQDAAAALLADSAMRTVSREQLGVRLEALLALTVTSVRAGFSATAVGYARQGLNLCAAAGFSLRAAAFAEALSAALVNMERNLEAAEVAQLGIGYVEGLTTASPLVEALLRHMLAGLNAIGDERGAAEAAIRLGDLRELAGDMEEAIGCYSSAANSLRATDQYARALATWAHVIRLAEQRDNSGALIDALWERADALAFRPGKHADEDIADLEAMLDRLHELFAEVAGRVPAGELATDADYRAAQGEAVWCTRAARLHWAVGRVRTAIDLQVAGVEWFRRIAVDFEESYLRHLLILANMYRMDGAIETAREKAALASHILGDERFEGHELRGMYRDLMELFDNDEA